MTLAAGLFTKTDREVKSVVIDCQPAMLAGELIDTVGSPVVTPTGPTIQGLVKNSEVIAKPGERSVGVSQGLRFFLLGGTAGTVYTVTVPYTTTEGQDLDASVKVKVLNDA